MQPISSALTTPGRGAHEKQNRKSRRPIPTLLSCALASCLALAAPAALAQSTAATLRGVVTADAAPVANAEIVATNLANGYTARATGQRRRQLHARSACSRAPTASM